MTTDRRKDDERIDGIHTIVTEMNVLVKQTHEAMFGNGRPGVKEEQDKMKGALSFLKWIAGAGGLTSIALVIKEIVKQLL